jgi:serine/threonine-protein kinase
LVTPKLRLVRPIAEGGMGSVWVADHLGLHAQVVVKFMAADLAHNAEAMARFSREAAAASQVKSPHVVQMLDYGVTDDNLPYIVMELLEGHDLASHLARVGKLPPPQVVAIVSQLARALVRALERGILHRDIKPSNVFLCDSGAGELFVKLLDFGIAKRLDHGLLDESTQTGALVGSPYYMSPEQVMGDKKVDLRCDLWALGVLAYEALTGERPFYADTVGQLVLKIYQEPQPVPSKKNPALPKKLDAWFARACARESAARFANAKEMADALEAAFARTPTAQ